MTWSTEILRLLGQRKPKESLLQTRRIQLEFHKLLEMEPIGLRTLIEIQSQGLGTEIISGNSMSNLYDVIELHQINEKYFLHILCKAICVMIIVNYMRI